MRLMLGRAAGGALTWARDCNQQCYCRRIGWSGYPREPEARSDVVYPGQTTRWYGLG